MVLALYIFSVGSDCAAGLFWGDSLSFGAVAVQAGEECHVLGRRMKGQREMGKFRRSLGCKQSRPLPGSLPNGQPGFSWSGVRGVPWGLPEDGGARLEQGLGSGV